MTTNTERQPAQAKKKSFWRSHQTLINFWLDTILLVCFLVLIWITVILRFVFPSADVADGYRLWGRTFGEFVDIQFAVLAVFTFAVLLHVMFHWSWVCGVIGAHFYRTRDGRKRNFDDGQQTIMGVGFMIVLLNVMALGIVAAVLSIQVPL